MFPQNTEYLLKNPASILMINPFMKEAKLEVNSRPGAAFFSYANNNATMQEEESLKKEPATTSKKNKKLNNLLICKQNFKNFWIRAEKWKSEHNVQDSEIIEKFNLQKINFSKIPSAEEMLEIYEEMMSREIQKKKKKNWSHQELCLFLWVCFNYAVVNSSGFEDLNERDWENLSGMFFTISPEECKYRFFDLLKSKTQKQAWSEDEDRVLLQLVLGKSEYSQKKSFKWKEIAKELNEKLDGDSFRLAKQCRERWFNHLDPDLNKGEWKFDEDYTLMERVLTIGKKWSKIAKYLRGRNENSVKNRFYSLLRKYRPQTEDAEKKAQGGMFNESDGLQLILNEIMKHLPHDFLSTYEKRCLVDLSDSASRTRDTASITENTDEKTISSEDFEDVSPSRTREETGIKSVESSKAVLVAGYKSCGQSGESKSIHTFELISRNGGQNNRKERNTEPSSDTDEENSIDDSMGKMIEEENSGSGFPKDLKLNKFNQGGPVSSQFSMNGPASIPNRKSIPMEQSSPIYDINKSNSLTRIMEDEMVKNINPNVSFNNNLMQYMIMIKNQHPLFSSTLSHLFNPYSIQGGQSENPNVMTGMNGGNSFGKHSINPSNLNYGNAQYIENNSLNVRNAQGIHPPPELNPLNNPNFQNNNQILNDQGMFGSQTGTNPYMMNVSIAQNSQNMSQGGGNMMGPNNYYSNVIVGNPSGQQQRVITVPGYPGVQAGKGGNSIQTISSGSSLNLQSFNVPNQNNPPSLISHHNSNNMILSGNSYNMINHHNSGHSIGSRGSSLFPILEERPSHDVIHEPHHNFLEPIKLSNNSIIYDDLKQKHPNIPSPGLESQLAKHGNSHYSDEELEKFFDCYENMIVSDSVSENLQNSLKNFKGSSFSSGRSVGVSNINSSSSNSHLMKAHELSNRSIEEKEEPQSQHDSNLPSHEHLNFNNSGTCLVGSNQLGSSSMDCESNSEGETKLPEANNINHQNHPNIPPTSTSPSHLSKHRKGVKSPRKKGANENTPFLNIIKEEINTSDSSHSFRQESMTDTENIEAFLPEGYAFTSIEDIGKILKSTAENPELCGAIDLILDNHKTPSLFGASRMNSHNLDGYLSDSRQLSLRTFSKPSLDSERLLSPNIGSNNIAHCSPFNIPLSVNSLQHLATPNEEYRRILHIGPSIYTNINDNRFDQYLKGSSKRNSSSDNLN